MKGDPLIDEVRAARHSISERFGHDTRALLAHYREMENQYRDRMLAEDTGFRVPDAARARETRDREYGDSA